MDFRAFRQETFTTALPTPGQSCAPTLRAHASAKAVLIFPGALGALQGSFHDVAFSRGAILGRQPGLSIPAPDHDPTSDLSPRRAFDRITSKIMIRSMSTALPAWAVCGITVVPHERSRY